jgi:hypothetical protein
MKGASQGVPLRWSEQRETNVKRSVRFAGVVALAVSFLVLCGCVDTTSVVIRNPDFAGLAHGAPE